MIDKAEAMKRCYQIPGFMWPVELGWLYDHFGESLRHAEVGSYCGRSLYATASGCKGRGNFFCVDHFGESDLGPDWVRRIFKATADAVGDLQHQVELIEKGSVEAFADLSKRKVRLDSVFIDATHNYAECKADIEMWSTLVRPGGLIAGHDYWPIDSGVMDAVNETGAFDVADGTRIWFRYK